MSSLDSTNTSPEQERGPVLLAISVSTTAFAFSSCFVRFCIRARSSGRFGWDDYSIVVAMIVALVGTILTMVEALSTSTPVRALQFSILSQPWLMMAAAMSKISICFFFLVRVLPVLYRATTPTTTSSRTPRSGSQRRPWAILLGAQIAVLSIVNTLSTLTTNLQCRPLEKLWDPSVEGECWDPMVQLGIGYTQGAFTVFTDFFLALFPVMMARDLGIGKKTSTWPFYLVSGLSFFAGFCAIIRTYELSLTSRQPTTYTQEVFFSSVLATLEQNLGILAANALCFAPIFHHCRHTAKSTHPKRPGHGDIEMGAMSRSNSRQHLRPGEQPRSEVDDSFFIIEGPRRSSVDTIDREKFLVSTKVAGMWGIGVAKKVTPSASASSSDDEDEPPTSIKRSGSSKSSSSKKSKKAAKAPAMSRSNSNRDSIVGYWHGDSGDNSEEPHPWGIVKTVSVEVVNEAISDLEKRSNEAWLERNQAQPEQSQQPEQQTGDAMVQGLKSIGGSIKSLGGSLSKKGSLKRNDSHNSQQQERGATKEDEQDWETILRGGPAGSF